MSQLQSQYDKKMFERHMKTLDDARKKLDAKEDQLRRTLNLPPRDLKKEEPALKIEIPQKALDLGEPVGIFVKVQVRKKDGELSQRFEYVKLED